MTKQATDNKRSRKKNFDTYKTFIDRKNVAMKLGSSVSLKTKRVIDSMLRGIGNSICDEASGLARSAKRQTLTDKDVFAAIKILFPGELAQNAIADGAKAVQKFKASLPPKKKKAPKPKAAKVPT